MENSFNKIGSEFDTALHNDLGWVWYEKTKFTAVRRAELLCFFKYQKGLFNFSYLPDTLPEIAPKIIEKKINWIINHPDEPPSEEIKSIPYPVLSEEVIFRHLYERFVRETSLRDYQSTFFEILNSSWIKRTFISQDKFAIYKYYCSEDGTTIAGRETYPLSGFILLNLKNQEMVKALLSQGYDLRRCLRKEDPQHPDNILNGLRRVPRADRFDVARLFIENGCELKRNQMKDLCDTLIRFEPMPIRDNFVAYGRSEDRDTEHFRKIAKKMIEYTYWREDQEFLYSYHDHAQRNPFSLQFLSRNTIRDRLVWPNFVALVQTLPLPSVSKDYIIGKF